MLPDSSESRVSTRRLLVFGTAAIIIIVATVTIGLISRASASKQLRNWTSEQAIPVVAVITPGLQENIISLDLPGRLQPYSRAILYARVNGYLKSWKADIGTQVKAGQLLAEIETPDLDQQLLQAKADLASSEATASLAKTTAERWEALLNSGYVSKQAVAEKTGDFMTKQALVNAARANVDRLQALKSFARIIAPFDGLITARLTDIGALINSGSGAGQELFEVSNTRMLRVYVNVPQVYVPHISPGTTVTITVPEHPGKTYTAAVVASAQAVNNVSGATQIQIQIDNARGELLPGGFTNVNFKLPNNRPTMSVPASALIFNKAGLSVATIDLDDRVVLKPVMIMRDLGKLVELSAGLRADDRIIENPPDGISNGDSVRISSISSRN
ncbi:RND family efflux transporter, MFP subunit [Nitrosospira multiformis]|uniref:RND family efflux transporter, MFP subunit n=2 Tax=Nitrosospira multiformis TaxID=1231 RepID=A0A1I0G9G4_9PROT|nr:RND family efflux transporter, MFP subunit [Nitrosospira multiformis]